MAALNIEPGVYFIQNVGTGTVLDLTLGSSTNGTKVQGFAKHELDNQWVPAQLWVIARVANTTNQYTIENVNGRTYMDLSGNSNTDGTPIVCYQYTNGNSQRWIIQRTSSNTSYVIQSETSGTYVNLQGGLKDNGTPINIYAGNGPSTTNPNQLWNIVRA